MLDPEIQRLVEKSERLVAQSQRFIRVSEDVQEHSRTVLRTIEADRSLARLLKQLQRKRGE